jgi:hypothetical protein
MDTSGHNSANSRTYLGEFTIGPTVGGGTTATTIQDSQIQNELHRQISEVTLAFTGPPAMPSRARRRRSWS